MKKLFLLVASLGLLFAGNAMAKVEATEFDPIEHQRVVEVSSQLRCLVCQNQTIADSNAELAIDLRNQVIEQVKEGKTNEEIVDFMVERYGDFVVYLPPFKASTAILWLGPIFFFFGALIAIYISLKRHRQTQQLKRRLTPEERERAKAYLREKGN